MDCYFEGDGSALLAVSTDAVLAKSQPLSLVTPLMSSSPYARPSVPREGASSAFESLASLDAGFECSHTRGLRRGRARAWATGREAAERPAEAGSFGSM